MQFRSGSDPATEFNDSKAAEEVTTSVLVKI